MEFSSPIRIRWDVDFRGRAGRTKRIARQIREAAPLTVSLRIDGERGLADLPAIVNEFHKGSACVEAAIRLFPGADRILLWRYPIGVIWAVDGSRSFTDDLPDGAKAVSFVPDGETIRFLPDVVREFAESGAGVLQLPNVNAVRAVAERGHVPLATREQIGRAAEETANAGVALPGKRLVVHDYFLWRALRDVLPEAAGERVEFSGCQAGTAVAHVDWEGNVYPCESLPVHLGNLIDASFERIWAAPARKNIAAAIQAAPVSCDGCVRAADCLGGCRGAAYVSAGTMDAPDPSCPGREPPGSPRGASETGA